MSQNERKHKKKYELITHTDKKIVIDTILNENWTNFFVLNRETKETTITKEIELNWKLYVPIKADSPFIETKSVFFASSPEEYWSKEDLFDDLLKYMDNYVDIPAEFAYIAAYYIMLTYVYDNFTELPYLRVLWDYWSWKSRMLKVVWSVAYNPVMFSWWATLASMFRLINDFKWTLVIDEADFSNSWTTEGIIKLLNTGYQKWSPIMRVEWENFKVKCYDVFGPKIIWWRNEFSDKATESRCLTHLMKRSDRDDIPTTLGEKFEKDTAILRNKLFKFRIDYLDKIKVNTEIKINWVEPRLKQIILPLLSIVDDEDMRNWIIEFLVKKQEEMKEDRRSSPLGWILMIINEKFSNKEKKVEELDYKKILDDFYCTDHTDLNPKRLWHLFKENWIKSVRVSRWKIIRFADNKETLERLYKEYSIVSEETTQPP